MGFLRSNSINTSSEESDDELDHLTRQRTKKTSIKIGFQEIPLIKSDENFEENLFNSDDVDIGDISIEFIDSSSAVDTSEQTSTITSDYNLTNLTKKSNAYQSKSSKINCCSTNWNEFSSNQSSNLSNHNYFTRMFPDVDIDVFIENGDQLFSQWIEIYEKKQCDVS